jgi:tetratricopeptide (TPR) repeat protein
MNAELSSADDAIAGYELACSLFLALFEEFPKGTPYQAEYLAVVSNLGELLLTLERPVEALELLSEAFETIKLPSGEVSDRTNLSLSRLSYNLGRSHWCQGNPLRARQLFEDAHNRLELVLKQEPARQERPNQLAEIAVELYALCLTASAPESPDVQREVWQQTLHTLRDELTRAESDTWLSQQTAGQLRAMARLQWTIKRFNAAVSTMELSISQWLRLADGPQSVRWRDELDETQGDLAVLLMDLAEVQRGDSPTKAEGSLERAKALLVQLVERHPEDEFYEKHLHSVEALLQGLGVPNQGR